MRFRLPRPAQRWHRWFAWRPVKLASEWAWLEWVERKPCMGALGARLGGFEYRSAAASIIPKEDKL